MPIKTIEAMTIKEVKELTIKAILEKAIGLYDTFGWTRGREATTKLGNAVDYDDPEATSLCLNSAICRAAERNISVLDNTIIHMVDVIAHETFVTSTVLAARVHRLVSRVGGSGLIPRRAFDQTVVIDHNDTALKNKKEVVQLLKRAISLIGKFNGYSSKNQHGT